MNKSDSQRLAGHLESQGLKPVKARQRAGLVVVNTCGVRQSAEDRIYGLVPKIKKENPRARIIITGCLSERQDVKNRLGDGVDLWLPTAHIIDLGSWILGLKQKKDDYESSCDYLRLEPKYDSKFSAYVPIGNGCDNFCAYCVVPYARGREVYRPVEEILDEVESLVKRGYKEIILIAQNVNSYQSKSVSINAKKRGIDLNGLKQINFAKLLRLVNDIPGDFWIRFATSHPKDMSDELIKVIAESDKVCKHIHLPAQAGDNGVLKRMNRKYTRGDYIRLVGKIRRALKLQITIPSPRDKLQTNPKSQIPNFKTWKLPISITTDIIVGFPGETKAMFNNTKKLFKEIKFDMAYISQYSPRPGTAAKELKDNVSQPEKKRREEELMKILRKTALENNKKYVGHVVRVLVEGLNKRGEFYGKTGTGKNARIRNYELGIRKAVGKFIDVKIEKVQDFGLEGVLIYEL